MSECDTKQETALETKAYFQNHSLLLAIFLFFVVPALVELFSFLIECS